MKDENERKIEVLEAEILRLKGVCDDWAVNRQSWVDLSKELEQKIEILEAAYAKAVAQITEFDKRLDAEVKRAIGLTWGQAMHAFHDANENVLHRLGLGCTYTCVWPTRPTEETKI